MSLGRDFILRDRAEAERLRLPLDRGNLLKSLVLVRRERRLREELERVRAGRARQAEREGGR